MKHIWKPLKFYIKHNYNLFLETQAVQIFATIKKTYCKYTCIHVRSKMGLPFNKIQVNNLFRNFFYKLDISKASLISFMYGENVTEWLEWLEICLALRLIDKVSTILIVTLSYRENTEYKATYWRSFIKFISIYKFLY